MFFAHAGKNFYLRPKHLRGETPLPASGIPAPSGWFGCGVVLSGERRFGVAERRVMIGPQPMDEDWSRM